MNNKLTYILCSLGGIFLGLSFLGGALMLLALVGLLAFVFAYIYNFSRDASEAALPSEIRRPSETGNFKVARVTTKTAVISALGDEYVQEPPLVEYRQEQYWKQVNKELEHALGQELTLLENWIPHVHTAAYFLLRNRENAFLLLRAVGEGSSKISKSIRIGSNSGSILSRLLKTDEARILEGDLNDGKPLQIYSENVPVKSVLAVPIYNSKRVRSGFIMLDSLQQNAFANVSQEMLSYAGSIMQLLGTKIYAAANNHIQQEQYSVLYEYQKKFFQSMSVKDVYRYIGEYIEQYVPFDRMMLLVRDVQDEDLGRVVLCKGEDESYFQNREFSFNDKGLLQLAFTKNVPLERTFDTKQSYITRFDSKEIQNDSLRYLLALPSVSDIPVANFSIVLEKKSPEPYSEPDKSRLRTITGTAGFALERVMQFEKGKDQAMRDGLTGLINHRTMHEKLHNEKLRADRQKINVGLLMMDIDKFKSINDTYGHPAGDEIIKGIARTIVGEVRSEIDLVARYGGEEFVVALIDTTEPGLFETAERIRKAIENAAYFINEKQTLKVSVSIGAYLMRPDGKYSMAEGLKFADSALYKAKEGGRNQVVEYLESDVSPSVDNSIETE